MGSTALVVMFNKPAQEQFRVKLDTQNPSSKMTEEQAAVAEFDDGRAAVEANPGSGKSFMLQQRALRISSAMGTDVRTLHSFGFQLIRQFYDSMGLRHSPQISKRSLFRNMQEATRTRYDKWEDCPWDRDLLEYLEGNVYNRDLDKFLSDALDKCDDKEGAGFLQRTVRDLKTYRDYMMRRGLLSFDMMLRLPAENRELLERHYIADHVMVDEFQDVNQFQFDMVESMSCNVDVKSLVVVGDPKQCIYEWRGALSDAFPKFYESIPSAKRFEMTCNFRSKDEILARADEYWPSKLHGIRGSGGVVEGWDNIDPDELHPFQEPGRDCAVLCRYNRDAVAWQLHLAKHGIGVNLWGRGGFWNLKHIKLAMEQREKGGGWNALQERRAWKRLQSSQAMQEEDRYDEVCKDARWILSLTEEDLKILQTTLDDEDGVNVLTLHKSKGAEFREVLIHRADPKLQAERTLYYVGLTRAEDRLYLGAEGSSE